MIARRALLGLFVGIPLAWRALSVEALSVQETDHQAFMRILREKLDPDNHLLDAASYYMGTPLLFETGLDRG